jgi:anti-anti-sigma factor
METHGNAPERSSGGVILDTVVEGQVATLFMGYELDLYSLDELKEGIGMQVNDQEINRIVIDLQETQYVDSATLGVFAKMYRKIRIQNEETVLRMREQRIDESLLRHLVFRVPNDKDGSVRRLFETTGMDRVFEIEFPDNPEDLAEN